MARIKMLDRLAPEEGTYTIKFNFKDEESNVITPTEINWWLSDLNGDIVNGRSEVSATPDGPFYLTLSGDDLQLLDVKDEFDIRVVTLRGTYNSDRGTDLPFTHSVMFKVKALLIIAKTLHVTATDTVFTGEYLVC